MKFFNHDRCYRRNKGSFSDTFHISLIVFYRLCGSDGSVVTEGLSVLQRFSFKKVGLGEALLELFLI